MDNKEILSIVIVIHNNNNIIITMDKSVIILGYLCVQMFFLSINSFEFW